MFERFTERARQVVVLSQEEARALRHNYIGTEHLLLGLLREDGRAARTLGAHGVTLEPSREWVVEHVGRGQEEPQTGQLPLTPRMRKIFELALEDAQRLDQNAIGTQHLLIALLHDGEGAALHAMRALGAPPEEVWVSAFRQLGVDAPPYSRVGLPHPEPADNLLERIPAAALAGAASFVVGLFLGWLIWGA
jgi:ATP-dependent Clp protease ATP-binding subunit ClpC